MSEPVIELTGVSKRFDATQALDDVSLTLHAGETHALLGENGAGRMGEYTIEKDPTRDNGLRVLMGPFTGYDESNVEGG